MLLFRLNVHCNYDKLFCFKIIFSRCQGNEEAVHLQVIASLKRKKNQFSGFNTYYLPLLSFGRTQENFVNYEARASDLQN